MIETLLVILIVLWLLGFTVFHIGGIIHFLIVVILICSVFIWRLLTNR